MALKCNPSGAIKSGLVLFARRKGGSVLSSVKVDTENSLLGYFSQLLLSNKWKIIFDWLWTCLLFITEWTLHDDLYMAHSCLLTQMHICMHNTSIYITAWLARHTTQLLLCDNNTTWLARHTTRLLLCDNNTYIISVYHNATLHTHYHTTENARNTTRPLLALF